MLVLKIGAVFLMSASIGILYRIPRKLLVYASLVGVAAWLIMYYTMIAGATIVLADFLASVAIGVMAEILARVLKKPATIFIIPGFIPLVPGGDAYVSMLYMVKGQYVNGVAMGMQTILTGGAIAFGIFVSSTIVRLLINYNMESIWKNVDKS
ncbi:MAG: threonine/serine exporter family protein [Sporomusaceae bacterium]|nr:threonine/serine exporter family protein [Sporomusaceae bacterium]